MITARVSGGDQLRKAARDLRAMHDRRLSTAARRAVRDSVEEKLAPLLRASAAAHLPGGFRNTLVGALRVRTTAKLSVARGVGVSVTIWAQGRKAHRDVQAMNLGRLRHPLFGNRNYWFDTRVTPGFADRAVGALRPVLVRDVDQALSRVVDEFHLGR